MSRMTTTARAVPCASSGPIFPALVLFVFAIGGLGAPADAEVEAGPQFQVSDVTTGYTYERSPSVAADADGNFVVVWSAYVYGPPYGPEIQGRRFAADGAPAGDSFQVSGATTEYVYETRPAVAADDDGDFVVVWRGYEYGPPYGPQIQPRRFAADGAPAGDSFQVSSVTDYVYETDPAVAADADGDFVVVWGGYQYSGPPYGYLVQGRRFAADGTPDGDQFQVGSTTTGSVQERQPFVAMDAGGDFVVVWRDYQYPGPPNGQVIQGRHFAADAAPSGDVFQVSSDTSEYVYDFDPAVAAGADGDFVVVWRDYQYPGPPAGQVIQGRQFAVVGPPVVEIEIDIKPDSDSNPINKAARGMVPMAILGSDSFDVADVDVTTLAFGLDGIAPAHDLTKPGTLADHLEDANGDGLIDLLTHYRTEEFGFEIGEVEACLNGELLDGAAFEGCDGAKVIGTRGARRTRR